MTLDLESNLVAQRHVVPYHVMPCHVVSCIISVVSVYMHVDVQRIDTCNRGFPVTVRIETPEMLIQGLVESLN